MRCFKLPIIFVLLILPSLTVAQTGCQASPNEWRGIGLQDVSEDIRDITVSASADTLPVVFAATRSNVYKTNDCGEEWSKLEIPSIDGISNIHLANDRPDSLMVVGKKSIVRTTDGGAGWQQVADQLPYEKAGNICDTEVADTDFNRIYVGLCDEQSGGIYKTSNGGEEWSRLRDTVDQRLENPINLLELTRRSNLENVDQMYALIDSVTLLYLPETDSSWMETPIMEREEAVTDVEFGYPVGIFASTQNQNILRLDFFWYSENVENKLDTVSSLSLNANINELHHGARWSCATYLHVATDEGLYRNPTLIMPECYEAPDTVKTSDGLPHNYVNTVAYAEDSTMDSGIMFAGLKDIGQKGGVYMRKASNETVNLVPMPQIPKEVNLSQNYPNPFNPTTNIRFSLPQSEQVTLKIYDLLGREVQTLINRRMQPGTHTVEFKGTDLSSGVYVYRLLAGDYSESRKMLLVK